jgi:indolepyruvate ferredoxin oxidoreductase
MKGFTLLAALKGLRGTVFDVFGYTAERRREREQLARFEADLDAIAARLSPLTAEAAVALASIPMLYRGYGHVREASVKRAEGERERLLSRLHAEITPGEQVAA